MTHSSFRARPLDHLVLASCDLAAQAEIYRRLGFQVGAKNRHDWGTENHIVQFAGSFLELLGLGAGFAPPGDDAPFAPFAGFLARYLGHAQGLAMLALRTSDAGGDQALFASAGIGVGETFKFGRQATRPDGTQAGVAFTIAYARSKLIHDAGFFVCQHHHPENFWKPEFQVHANGAAGVSGIVMTAENPSDHAEFLSHFTNEREMLATSMGLDINLGNAHLEVLTPLAFRFRFGEHALGAERATPGFAAFRVAVRSLSGLRALLSAHHVPHDTHGAFVIVGPDFALGTAIAFEAAQE